MVTQPARWAAHSNGSLCSKTNNFWLLCRCRFLWCLT